VTSSGTAAGASSRAATKRRNSLWLSVRGCSVVMRHSTRAGPISYASDGRGPRSCSPMSTSMTPAPNPAICRCPPKTPQPSSKSIEEISERLGDPHHQPRSRLLGRHLHRHHHRRRHARPAPTRIRRDHHRRRQLPAQIPPGPSTATTTQRRRQLESNQPQGGEFR